MNKIKFNEVFSKYKYSKKETSLLQFYILEVLYENNHPMILSDIYKEIDKKVNKMTLPARLFYNLISTMQSGKFEVI